MENTTINNNHVVVAFFVFAVLFIGVIIQIIAALSFLTTHTFCGVSLSGNSNKTLPGKVINNFNI